MDLSVDDYRIDVVWLAREAIRTVLDHWRRALALAWAPYALLFAAELVAAAVAGGHTVAGAVATAVVRAVAVIAFGSILAVRWQRFVLLGQRQPEPLFSPAWGLFVTAALKFAVVLLGVALAIVLVLELVPVLVAAPLAVLGSLAMLALAIRVCLVFPAAAMGRVLSVRAASHGLTGNAVRLFGCLTLCALPFTVLRLLVDQVAAVSPTLIWIALDAVSTAITLAGVAAVATALADVYRNLAKL